MSRIKFMLLMLAMPLTLLAQTQKVSGSFVYYGDPSMSLKDARAAAIENARVQAVASVFGTVLTQNTFQQASEHNGQFEDSFLQLSESEVKGQWVEDTKEPKIVREELTEGGLVIEVEVEGKAKAISNESVEFETLTLRNGTEKRFADTNFKEGDDLFLYFKAPADGYVAVYLVDESRNAFCLLPYGSDGDGQQPVEHGKEYVFFSPKHQYDIPRSEIDEMAMTCADERMERNQLYVVYSPNAFTKAIDQPGAKLTDDLRLPRQLPFKDFSKWLVRSSNRDKKMNRKVIFLQISK